MHLCFLGTASGIPESNRFGQTVILTIDDDKEVGSHFLLDVGDGASSLLMRYGYDHRAIRAIIISHMHADHHGGFVQVMKTNMHLGRTEELLVLAPEEGISALQTYLEASYLTDSMLGYPVKWLSLAEAVEHAEELPGRMLLHAFPNSHLDSARRRFGELGYVDHGRTFESYSIVLERLGNRIVYSGNLNGPRGADELEPFLEPCNTLICELAHVDPKELGRLLAGRKIDRTVLAHFHPKWQDVPEVEILRQIRSGAEGRGELGEIVLTQDGDQINCTQVGV